MDGGEPLKWYFPCLIALKVIKKCLMASIVWESGTRPVWKWEWKTNPKTREDILKYNLYFNRLWGKGFQGMKKSVIEVDDDLNPVHWSIWIPLKIRGFVWKVRFYKIPYKTALHARGVNTTSEECSICFGVKESVYTCCVAVTLLIWFIWCGLSRPGMVSIRSSLILSSEVVTKVTLGFMCNETTSEVCSARYRFSLSAISLTCRYHVVSRGHHINIPKSNFMNNKMIFVSLSD